MLKRLTLFFFVLTLSVCFSFSFASTRTEVKKGNDLYKRGRYDEAYSKYVESQVKAPDSAIIQNNLGLSLYKQGKYDESIANFEKAAASKELSSHKRSEVLYNMGNSYAKKQDFDNAVNAYKRAIDLNQDNKDARYNLTRVRKLVKQQPPQQQQSKNGKSKKDKEKQKQQKQQHQKKDNDAKKDKPKEQRSSGDEKDDKKDKSQGIDKQTEDKDISKEDAERILDALQKEDERNPVRLNKDDMGAINVDKDW